MASFRAIGERLTMKMPQENGLPTSTWAGPENDIVTPISATEYARSLKELRRSEGALTTPLDWFRLIERLAGRLFRCKAWLGPPNVGLRTTEKSTAVLHCIEMLG